MIFYHPSRLDRGSLRELRALLSATPPGVLPSWSEHCRKGPCGCSPLATTREIQGDQLFGRSTPIHCPTHRTLLHPQEESGYPQHCCARHTVGRHSIACCWPPRNPPGSGVPVRAVTPRRLHRPTPAVQMWPMKRRTEFPARTGQFYRHGEIQNHDSAPFPSFLCTMSSDLKI